MSNSDAFKLTSNEAFASRTKDIFAGLGAIEDKHNASEKLRDSQDRHQCMKGEPSIDDYLPKDKSKEAMKKPWDNRGDRGSGHKGGSRDFLAPQPPRARGHRGKYVPDFRRNPQNYTKYDLSDVSTDQLSNRANTAAAFDFLRQQQELREKEVDKSHDAEPGSHAVVFKKPKKMVKHDSETLQSDSVQNESAPAAVLHEGGKIKMQEYVVGQKIQKEKQKKLGTVAAGDKVGLHHLFEEEDDEQPSPSESTFKSSQKPRGIRKRKASSDEETA